MIPLSVPNIKGKEWKYVKECLDTEWVSSAGSFVERFEDDISNFTGAKYVIACSSGTSALHISLKLSGVKPGDEVIIPSLTFIAPVNAIKYNGANPIFMDADNYFNLDVEKTIEFLNNETFQKNGFSYNKKTKNKITAIVPVHMWGNAVDLAPLINICFEMGIKIVEDSSESLGTFYNKNELKGKHTGTLGTLGCLSFNGNKIITTGGGGAILTNDKKLAIKARYLTTQAKDDPIRYIHNDIGFNYRLTNVQAAIGVGQFEMLGSFLERKKEIYQFYLSNINDTNGYYMAQVPEYSINNHWLNILKINKNQSKMNRESLMKYLHKNKIQTRPPWYLNHLQKPYKKYQKYKIEKSFELVDYSLCIPSSSNLSKTELLQIIKYINE